MFTDDDLKRLKDHIADVNSGNDMCYWKVDRLLARLEAAENFILLRGAVIQMEKNTRKIETAYSAWRKACGK